MTLYPEHLSWPLFVASGLDPFSGQAAHFQLAALKDLEYALNHYRREAERHDDVLEKHLAGRAYLIDDGFTIADIAAWGWVGRADRVLQRSNHPLTDYPHLKRWLRPLRRALRRYAHVRVGKYHAFKREMDEETRNALFLSNYPKA